MTTELHKMPDGTWRVAEGNVRITAFGTPGYTEFGPGVILRLNNDPLVADTHVALVAPTPAMQEIETSSPEASMADVFAKAILAERIRAHEKHGPTSMEQAPLLSHKRASVLVEEAVECMKALNDHDHGDIELSDTLYSDAWAGCDVLDTELIQTAAMAYTWWANRRGDQLPAVKPKAQVPQRVIDFLLSFADRNGEMYGALGSDDVVDEARAVLEELGIESP